MIRITIGGDVIQFSSKLTVVHLYGTPKQPELMAEPARQESLI